MAIKIILILSALTMAGCVMFPSTTQISANSKLDKIDNPTDEVDAGFVSLTAD